MKYIFTVTPKPFVVEIECYSGHDVAEELAVQKYFAALQNLSYPILLRPDGFEVDWKYKV